MPLCTSGAFRILSPTKADPAVPAAQVPMEQLAAPGLMALAPGLMALVPVPMVSALQAADRDRCGDLQPVVTVPDCCRKAGRALTVGKRAAHGFHPPVPGLALLPEEPSG